MCHRPLGPRGNSARRAGASDVQHQVRDALGLKNNKACGWFYGWETFWQAIIRGHQVARLQPKVVEPDNTS